MFLEASNQFVKYKPKSFSAVNLFGYGIKNVGYPKALTDPNTFEVFYKGLAIRKVEDLYDE